jgi:hypothetical protein
MLKVATRLLPYWFVEATAKLHDLSAQFPVVPDKLPSAGWRLTLLGGWPDTLQC